MTLIQALKDVTLLWRSPNINERQSAVKTYTELDRLFLQILNAEKTPPICEGNKHRKHSILHITETHPNSRKGLGTSSHSFLEDHV